jgi:hypothetical protein
MDADIFNSGDIETMLTEEMLAFFFSGAPTTAEFLSWTVFKLAGDVGLQTKLLREINKELKEGRTLDKVDHSGNVQV